MFGRLGSTMTVLCWGMIVTAMCMTSWTSVDELGVVGSLCNEQVAVPPRYPPRTTTYHPSLPRVPPRSTRPSPVPPVPSPGPTPYHPPAGPGNRARALQRDRAVAVATVAA